MIKAGLLPPENEALQNEIAGWKPEPVPGPRTAMEILEQFSGMIAADQYVCGVLRRMRANAGLSEEDTSKLIRWYHQNIQQPVMIRNWFANPVNKKFTERESSDFSTLIVSFRTQFQNRGFLSQTQYKILVEWRTTKKKSP